MVKPILLAKMLHCKTVREKSTRNTRSKPKRNRRALKTNSTDLSKVKIEQCDFDMLQNVCRVCLKEGIVPIFGENGEDLPDALSTFAGIDVVADDIYPKYLCVNCHSLVRGAILLRKTALQSDQILKQPPPKDTIDSKLKLEDIGSNIDEANSFDPIEDSLDSTYEKIQVSKEPKTFYCQKCDIKFDNKEELVEHRISEEHENKRFTCKVCNKTYSPLYFKRHMTLHELKPSHICDICGKKFIVQGQFTRHRMTHFYSLPFKCPLCPYKGRFSESLKMHMRSHTGEKPYQCTQCPHRFVNKSNLNKHMLTHRGEHDYKCDSCGRGFYTKRNLELHFKVDHTGIKEHVCNVCGKAFGYRKQMMKHQLKVHKREKLRSGRLPLYLLVESKKQQGEEVE